MTTPKPERSKLNHADTNIRVSELQNPPLGWVTNGKANKKVQSLPDYQRH